MARKPARKTVKKRSLPPTRGESPAAVICAAIRRVPRGRVSTYGWIADLAGLPGRSRLVGTVLKEVPAGMRLPWHRIVNASGRISLPEGSGAAIRQYELLQSEGVMMIGRRIDLSRYGWPERRGQIDELLWKPR
jgi:methylated-DNA-protein-cysteine methyltransferase-like protein